MRYMKEKLIIGVRIGYIDSKLLFYGWARWPAKLENHAPRA